MPSLLFVLLRSKNFTSIVAVQMPPSGSIDHYLGSKEKTSKIRPRSSFIIPCCIFQAIVTCFEHSVLFKVNSAGAIGHPVKGTLQHYGRGGGPPNLRPTVPPTTLRRCCPTVKQSPV